MWCRSYLIWHTVLTSGCIHVLHSRYTQFNRYLHYVLVVRVIGSIAQQYPPYLRHLDASRGWAADAHCFTFSSRIRVVSFFRDPCLVFYFSPVPGDTVFSCEFVWLYRRVIKLVCSRFICLGFASFNALPLLTLAPIQTCDILLSIPSTFHNILYWIGLEGTFWWMLNVILLFGMVVLSRCVSFNYRCISGMCYQRTYCEVTGATDWLVWQLFLLRE